MLWSAARLAYRHPELWQLLCRQVQRQAARLTPQHCATALWSMALLAMQSPAVDVLILKSSSTAREFQADLNRLP